MDKIYKKCTLCAAACNIDRTSGALGRCRSSDIPKIARASLHMWEEPIISGTNGSGTIFFSGCSLGCVFCQNSEISRSAVGKPVTVERVAEIMLELQDKGAHNVNFVTPTHFAPTVKSAILLARRKGFNIPTVYNTGSYDTVETLKELEGFIDIYLPDLKYFRPSTAWEYSKAENYVEVARAAIAEMVRQTGAPKLSDDGLLKSGTVVRVLLLPNHVAEAKLSVKYLYDTYGDDIYVSLMNQYTPMPNMNKPLDRRVTKDEYDEVCSYAVKLGIKNGFTQQSGTAEESFIPPFDNSGV